jgi:hypothetical protein
MLFLKGPNDLLVDAFGKAPQQAPHSDQGNAKQRRLIVVKTYEAVLHQGIKDSLLGAVGSVKRVILGYGMGDATVLSEGAHPRNPFVAMSLALVQEVEMPLGAFDSLLPDAASRLFEFLSEQRCAPRQLRVDAKILRNGVQVMFLALAA